MMDGTRGGMTGGTKSATGKGQDQWHSGGDSCSQQKMENNGVVPQNPTAKTH